MQPWMITVPTARTTKREIREIMSLFDVKRWTIAVETGKGGLEHYQMRWTVSGDPNEFFERVHDLCPAWHLEKASTEDDRYERKDGRFWSSEDTTEIRQCRFGTLTQAQQAV